MEAAGAADRIELAAQARHAIADQPAIRLDLGLARAAEKAETAPLALEVGPAADQPAGLVIEMRQLDLEPALGGARAFAEDLEDQAGAVDHLALQRSLEVTLLHRREARIEHGQLQLAVAHRLGQGFHLTRTDQRARLGRADAQRHPLDHVDADRRRETGSLLQARIRIARAAAKVRIDHDCSRAPREFVGVTLETGAHAFAQSSLFCSSARFSGWAGWIVETACL